MKTIVLGIERDIDLEVYNTALAVRRWVLRENEEPGGFCQEASRELQRRLEKKGYHPRLRCGIFRMGRDWCITCQHWWLTLPPDDAILDVTADQFNEELEVADYLRMNPIVYGTIDELEHRYREI